MPGPAVRFDYQSLDAKNGRLYISHMNADQLVVFDTARQEGVANLDGFRRVHGVWGVPELARVYASATGDHAKHRIDVLPAEWGDMLEQSLFEHLSFYIFRVAAARHQVIRHRRHDQAQRNRDQQAADHRDRQRLQHL